MSDNITSQQCSLYGLSTKARNVASKNLPDAEQVLLCFETRMKFWNTSDRKYYFSYFTGIITKHWLLSVYVNDLGAGETVCLMHVSEVEFITQEMQWVNSDQVPSITVTGRNRTKTALFYFDSQSLCYKFEETLRKAMRDAQQESWDQMQQASLQQTRLAVEEQKNQPAPITLSAPTIQPTRQTKTDGELKTILFLAADPTDASRLRLGEELREIQEKIQLAKMRDRFILHQRMSVRPTDISQALLDVQPQIVHFSGHGTENGAVCVENQSGESRPIQPGALAALFKQFAHQVNCVVLNACYSEIQANAIAQHIDYVVGMNQAIGDHAAIAFSVGFYQALGAGCTIQQAYELGCVQIRLQDIPEYLTPVLITKNQPE